MSHERHSNIGSDNERRSCLSVFMRQQCIRNDRIGNHSPCRNLDDRFGSPSTAEESEELIIEERGAKDAGGKTRETAPSFEQRVPASGKRHLESEAER